MRFMVGSRRWQALTQPVVQSLDHVPAAAQQFVVGYVLRRPAFQSGIQPQPFTATELLIRQICVMDDLCDALHLGVSYRKLFSKRLEGAVLPTMPEPGSAEHIEGN